MAFCSRAVIQTCCADDPARQKRLAVRFAKIVSPLVAYLASADCALTAGSRGPRRRAIAGSHGWSSGASITTDGDWTADLIAEKLGDALTTV